MQVCAFIHATHRGHCVSTAQWDTTTTDPNQLHTPHSPFLARLALQVLFGPAQMKCTRLTLLIEGGAGRRCWGLGLGADGTAILQGKLSNQRIFLDYALLNHSGEVAYS